MTTPTPDAGWRFDIRLGSTGRYRNPRTGRIMSDVQAHAVLDRTLANAANPVKVLAQQLREGNVRLEDWRLQMQRQIKSAHLASMAAQKGGWNNLTQSDFGKAGAIIKGEYQYLEGFVADIQSGKQRLDGTLQRRAQMYIDKALTTYHEFGQQVAADRGLTHERSKLNPADHCAGCIGEAAKGWQVLGQMIPIGERDCRTNCRCSIEYGALSDDGTITAVA